MTRFAFIDIQPRIPGVIKFTRKLQVHMFIEGRTNRQLCAYIPSTELKMRFVLVAEETVVHVRNYRPYTRLSDYIQLDMLFAVCIPVPAFHQIKKKEVRSVVQIVVKTVCIGKIDGTIYRF